MFPAGTRPSAVGGLKRQLTVSTMDAFAVAGCCTVMIALVNATSVSVSVHCRLGQSGAPGIGEVGCAVVTLKVVFPFLISVCEMVWLPATVTGAGFWPGGWFLPDGFVQVAVGLPVAVSVTRTSCCPSPARAPDVFRCRPWSVKVSGTSFFRCTLEAEAPDTARLSMSKGDRTAIAMRCFIGWLLVFSIIRCLRVCRESP